MRVTKSKVLTCVAERRVVVVEVVVKPVPVQDHLVAVLVEVRDVQVAVAVQHTTCKISSTPPPFEGFPISRLNRIWHLTGDDP